MPTQTRRSNGTGGLYQDGRGYWTAAVELPSLDGTRRRKVVRSKSKALAVQKLRDLTAELERIGNLQTSSMTLEKWLGRWLIEIAHPRLKPKTFTGYESIIRRYIVPSIGKVRLDQLTAAHIRQMHNYVTSGGRSTTTASGAHRVLSKALTDAMREGVVNRNAALMTDAPKKAVVEYKTLSPSQARTLLRSVADDPYQRTNWTLALLLGLRQGERLGITEEFLDLEKGILTVAWQLQSLNYRHGDCDDPLEHKALNCPYRHFDVPAGVEARQVKGALWLLRPKSKAGWRKIPLPPAVVTLLKDYIAHHPPTANEGLIFTKANGHLMWPRDDERLWKAALEKAGLPKVKLHSARHTTASLLMELGVPEQVRVAIMGHSSVTTTAIYTHLTDGQKLDAIASVGNQLGIEA